MSFVTIQREVLTAAASAENALAAELNSVVMDYD